MDRALSRNGLKLRPFAEQWGVNVKTVRRDIEAFRALGQRIELGYGHERGRVLDTWRYRSGVDPLFAANLPKLK